MEAWIWVVVIGAGLSIAFGSWFFSADQRQRRKMRSVPTRSIREVMDGELVRITGEAEIASPIAAPLTGRPCAYWRVVVKERRRSGKNSYWATLIDDHEGVDFVLRDETGGALVRTDHARAVLDKDASGGTGFFDRETEELEIFLAERGHSTHGFIFKKTMKYYEGVIEPGETITALGVGRWEVNPDPGAQGPAGFRERPKRLVLDAPDDGPLLLTDERLD